MATAAARAWALARGSKPFNDLNTGPVHTMPLQASTPGDLAQARDAGRLAWRVLREVAAAARPGVLTRQLSDIAAQHIARARATPTTRGFRFADEPPFPAPLSINTNEEVMFGIPGERVLNAGDIVTLDLTLRTALGWHADAAISLAIGAGERADRLRQGALAATTAAIGAMAPGVWWSAVMARVEEAVGESGLSLLPGACGHGIGRALHERPSFFTRDSGNPDVRLRAGMILAIEPVVIERPATITQDANGWTQAAPDGVWSAFEERMVAVTAGGVEVLSRAEPGN